MTAAGSVEKAMEGPVRKRRFGDSDLFISEIGFGCGPTAGLMIEGDRQTRIEVVAKAFEEGINYFDTAGQYGEGASEINLGEALKALNASPIISTKVTLGLADLDDIAGAVRTSVETSLRRLRRERLEIVFLHNRIGPQRAPKPNIGSGALLSVD